MNKTAMSFQAQALFWTYVLGKYLEMETLGHMQTVFLALQARTSFSKWLYYFPLPHDWDLQLPNVSIWTWHLQSKLDPSHECDMELSSIKLMLKKRPLELRENSVEKSHKGFK